MRSDLPPFSSAHASCASEDEDTRIFSRTQLEGLLEPEPPRHRYVACAIPALGPHEPSDAPREDNTAASVGQAVWWTWTLSVIGAAAVVALAA